MATATGATNVSLSDAAFAGDPIHSLENPSFGKRFRYRFDQSFGSGALGALKWLLGTILLLSIPLTIIVQLVQPHLKSGTKILSTAILLKDEPHGIVKWLDAYYQTILIFLGKGTFSNSAWVPRIFSAFGILISLVITATLFGFVITNVNRRMSELKKGKGIIIESGHTTILGWTPQIFSMISQIEKSNASEERQGIVVIISPQSKEIMDDEIKHRVGEIKYTRIIVKSGDPANPRVLAESSINKSRNVIILGNYWALTTQLALAIQACLPENSGIPIIAEISDENTATILKNASKTQVYSLNREDFISRITAHSLLQPGITTVLLDLLDFDGSEIYVKSFKQAEGKTYGEIVNSFNGIPFGIYKANGEVTLTPDSSVKIEANDRIVGLAEDFSKFTWKQNSAPSQIVPPTSSDGSSMKPENILIIGWSRLARTSVLEISKVCAPGTKFTFFAQSSRINLDEFKGLEHPNVSIDVRHSTGTAEDLADILNSQEFTRIGIFGYKTRGLPVPESEAITLLTALQVAHSQKDPSCKSKDAFVVAEVQDVANVPITHQIDLDDMVVSDRLSTLMMSQLAETNELGAVFDQLFGAKAPFINSKPSTYFAVAGTPISFGDLIAAGHAKGQTIIGYYDRGASAGGATYVNPSRDAVLNPSDSLSVISLGELG
jgi:hypothetical protein